MVYQQSDGHISGLMALPIEIVVHIMCQMPQPLMLSMSCRELWAIYQNDKVYKTYERQNHQFMYMLAHDLPAIRTLHEKLNTLMDTHRHTQTLPMPNTPEWRQLLDQPFAALSWQAQLKKTYITAWEVLSQAERIDNAAQAVALMILITDLSFCVNARDYMAKLAHTLSWNIFYQLATIHLECCLNLLAIHFPLEKGSPAYEFFLVQCPPLDRVKTYKDGQKYLKNPHEKFFSNQAPLIIDEYIDYIKPIRQPYYQSTHPQTFLTFLIQKLSPESGYVCKTYEALLFLLLERGCDFRSAQSKNILFYILYKGGLTYADGMEANELYLVKLFNQLLAQGADYNTTNRGITLFLAVCRYIKAREILHLLALPLLQQPGLDVNATDNKGRSALTYLIQKNQLSAISALLQHPHLNHKMFHKNETNTLYFAIEKNDVVTVNTLLRYSSIGINTRAAAFLYALWRNKESKGEMVTLFFQGKSKEKQALLDQALAKAINTPKEEFCKLVPILLHYGADCNAEGEKTHETALLTACRYEQEALVKWLLQQPNIDVNVRGVEEKDGLFPLFIAIKKKNLVLLKLLLQHPDIEINKKTTASYITAATRAAGLGMAEALVLFAQCLLNQTPIKYRRLTDVFFDIVFVPPYYELTDTEKDELLNTFLQSMGPLQKKVFIHYVLNLMLEPSKHLSKHGFYIGRLTKVVPILLQYGVDCNICNKKGKSVLMFACGQQKDALVKLLMQQPNINVNAVNSKGKTALHYAINQGSVALVQLLLASNKITDATRLQAFNYAIKKGQTEIASLLKLC
jgi:ankyrin repeat protein